MAELSDLQKNKFPEFALRIPADRGHVNLGTFWKPGTNYGRFMWEVYVRPTDQNVTGYFISAGYGGAHNVLFGFNSNSTHFSVTGNIWDGADTVDIDSPLVFPLNEWYHIAQIWDQTNLLIAVNGVFWAKTAYSGTRSTPAPADSIAYFGGSNHSKADQDKAWVRAWEWILPPITTGLKVPFRPHRFPQSTYFSGGRFLRAAGVWDLTLPGRVIHDLSDGMPQGTQQVVTNTVVAGAGITGNGNARNIVTAFGMANSPKTVPTAVTTGAHTSASLIAAAQRASLAADVDVGPFFEVGGTGADIVLTAREPAPNDPTMNFTIEDVTSAGITEDTTAVQTTPGYGERIRHSGILEGLLGTSGAFDDSTLVNSPEDEKAYWVPADFSPSTPPQDTIPGTALVYDGFNRLQDPLHSDSPTIGSTEGGTLGVLPWSNPTAYGCAAGWAFPMNSADVVSLVDTGETDVSVRVAWNGEGILYLRYVDASNYISVSFVGTTINVYNIVASTPNLIYTSAAMSASTAIRVDLDGGDIEVFNNGVSVHSSTPSPALVAGDKYGFSLVTSSLGKINTFEIYAA